jgi:hypothetical protein
VALPPRWRCPRQPQPTGVPMHGSLQESAVNPWQRNFWVRAITFVLFHTSIQKIIILSSLRADELYYLSEQNSRMSPVSRLNEETTGYCRGGHTENGRGRFRLEKKPVPNPYRCGCSSLSSVHVNKRDRGPCSLDL